MSVRHPYLTTGAEFINECTLTLDAHMWLPTDDRGLPAGTQPVEDAPYDFRTGRLIGNTVIDYAFTGLTRDSNGLAWVYLTVPDGRCTRLCTDEHYRLIELYTGDTQPPNKQRRGLGVEPMTCAPNDFRAGNNLIILDPGQSITTRWGIYPD
jgi:aldose 1-epimerase